LLGVAVLLTVIGAIWMALIWLEGPETRSLDMAYAKQRVSGVLTWSVSGRDEEWSVPGLGATDVRVLHAEGDPSNDWFLVEVAPEKWEIVESAIFNRKADSWRVTRIDGLGNLDRSVRRTPSWLREARSLADLKGVHFDHRSHRLGWILTSREKHWVLICDSPLR
jgi:hypothetical protein